MGEIWQMAVLGALNQFYKKVVMFLPNLLAMVTILLVGLLVACIVRRILQRTLVAFQFDKVSDRWGLTMGLSKGGALGVPSDLVSRFFYWLIVLVTIILSINALEVAATQALIARFFSFLPHLFAALFVLLIGYLLALFLSEAVVIAAVNAQIRSARLLSGCVRWFVIILAFTMALYHVGIAEKVIIAAFAITYGGIVLALGIAFGWGGRELARDFLERLYGGKKEDEGSGSGISHL